MSWQSLNYRSLRLFVALTVGAVTITGAIFWGIKGHRIRNLMREVAQVETELAAGQELWREFPPLDPSEKKALQEAQKRLLQMLPSDKNLPTVLQQVSLLTIEYNLSDVFMKTVEFAPSASASAVAASTGAQRAKAAASSNGITSFPVKLSFTGDYQQIAYFLDALENLPRLVRVDSLRLQRGVPLIKSEVTWRAYYKDGEFPIKND